MKRSGAGGTGPKRRPTLKDVADLAGVSPMTVSNVVNGRHKGYNDDTRDKVLWAIRSTNYHPDIAARSLRTDRRMAIGMLVVQQAQLFLSDPYITNLLEGLCAGLNQHGYSMVLQGLTASQCAQSSLVQQRLSDGLCVLMSAPFDPESALARTLTSLGQPVVLFQQDLAGTHEDICVLRQDDAEGARMLCAHLVERGARKIVMILPQPEWPAMKARLAGVQQYLASSSHDVSLTVLNSIDETPAATEGVLAGHMSSSVDFDTVIAGNDQMAVSVLRMLGRRGISVPGAVRVAGFNGFSFLDFLETRLTTVRSPAFKLGNLGAQHIIRHIEHGKFETSKVILPVEFVAGATT